MACLAELVESKNWNEYSETFLINLQRWRSSVIINVQIIAKGKKCVQESWLAILIFKSVKKFYFVYNVLQAKI